jgi:DNA-binding PadR family transcriptional regulator
MFDHNRGFIGNWFQGFPGGFGPRFERGDIKFIILSSLLDKPRHGYEIIQELEKKFHGFYSPSPGTVYPTLQLLEDEDYITSEQKSGKKVYTITATGGAYLEEHKEELEQMHKRVHSPWGDKGTLFMSIREEIGKTARLVFGNAAHGKIDTKKMEKIRTVFEKARGEIETIINEDK